jgi:hypothetical protein
MLTTSAEEPTVGSGVGVKRGVGVKVGVDVGVRVSVGVMLESPGGGVLVRAGVAEGIEGVAEEASGVGGSMVAVASPETGNGVGDEVPVGTWAVGLDACVAGTGDDAVRVGDGLNVGPVVGEGPSETDVGAGAVPHPANVAISSSTAQTGRSKDRQLGNSVPLVDRRLDESRM